MGYTEAANTAEYIGVTTTKPPQAQGPTNVYSFPVPAAGEPVPTPPLDVISARQMKKLVRKQKKKERKEEEKKKKKKKKKRGSLLLCCSNFEIDDEEGKERIREALEGHEKKRISLVMCCSNLEVGSKKDIVDGFGK